MVEEEEGDFWDDVYDKTRRNIRSLGETLSNFGEFIASNINMVDCCNNV